MLGVPVPDFVREMYARHDGAALEGSGHRGLFLFPMWWEWMPLDDVVAQAEFALLWMKQYDVDAFPFAIDGTGRFMACGAGEDELTTFFLDTFKCDPGGARILAKALRQFWARDYLETAYLPAPAGSGGPASSPRAG